MNRLWSPFRLVSATKGLRPPQDRPVLALSRPLRRPETLTFFSTLHWFGRWPLAILKAVRPATLRPGSLAWDAWTDVEQRYPRVGWWARACALQNPPGTVNRIRFGWRPQFAKGPRYPSDSSLSIQDKRVLFNPRELAFALSLLNPQQEAVLFLQKDEDELTVLDILAHGTNATHLGDARSTDDLILRTDLLVAALTAMGTNPARFMHADIFWTFSNTAAIEALWSTPSLDLSPSGIGESRFLLHAREVNELFSNLSSLLQLRGARADDPDMRQRQERLRLRAWLCVRGPWGLDEPLSEACLDAFSKLPLSMPRSAPVAPLWNANNSTVGAIMEHLLLVRTLDQDPFASESVNFFRQLLGFLRGRVEREALASWLATPSTGLDQPRLTSSPSPAMDRASASAAPMASTDSDSGQHNLNPTGRPDSTPSSPPRRSRRL